MDLTERIEKIITLLKKATHHMEPPMSVQIVHDYGKDPFLILVSCLLSLRARDKQTYPVSKKLFEFVRTPEQLVAFPTPDLEKILHPLGFYRRKAHIIKAVSQELLDRYEGKVPKTYEELRSIKGIGPKTANLVLGVAFDIPAICVDVHVHRVSNRLGIVNTKTPEQTERQLKQILPQKYWIEYNHLLVMWGQNICVPLSPLCSQCVLFSLCPRKGVVRSR